MKNKITSLLFLLIIANSLYSQHQTTLSVTADTLFPQVKVECGPWLQAVGENEFTVVWTTNMDAAVWVELAPDDSSNFYAVERPKYYQSLWGRRVVGKLHSVRITGLEKGSGYRYRIFQQPLLLDEGNRRMIFGEARGSEVRLRPPYHVTTLDSEKEEISFSMVNDIHGNDTLFRKLTGDIKTQKPDFVVFNGDMLTQIESETEMIDGYLRSASSLFASDIPLFYLRGNHENRGSFSWELCNYFPSPSGKPYYAFRHGPAFFIFLDCGEDKPDSDVRYYGLSLTDQLREEEAIWLKEVVKSEEFINSPVKIVFLHMPPGLRDWHGAMELKRLFVPVLNDAGIDLMLSAHLHHHVFVQQGEIDNNFPVIINANTCRMDVNVTAAGIKISAVDSSGKTVNEYSLEK